MCDGPRVDGPRVNGPRVDGPRVDGRQQREKRGLEPSSPPGNVSSGAPGVVAVPAEAGGRADGKRCLQTQVVIGMLQDEPDDIGK